MKTLHKPLFLIGPAGVGKSTIGKRLAAKLQCPFYDLDRIIEERAGAGIAHIFDIEGEAGFRKREHAMLAQCAEESAGVIATGAGAVLTEANCELMKTRGKVVYLYAPQAVLTARVERNNHHRPLLQVEDVSSAMALMLAKRTPLYQALASIHIDAHDKSIIQIVKEICELL